MLETAKKALPSSGGGALGSCTATYFLGLGSCWTSALTFFVAHMAYVLAAKQGLTKAIPVMESNQQSKFGMSFNALGVSTRSELNVAGDIGAGAVLQGIALMVMGRGVYDSLVAMGGSILGAQGVHAAGFT